MLLHAPQLPEEDNSVVDKPIPVASTVSYNAISEKYRGEDMFAVNSQSEPSSFQEAC